MTTPRVILTTLLLCTSLLADSKTEADLRIRLAASEAAHAAALRDKADLTAALAKLTAQDSAQTARASIASQSASAQRSDASTAAATNAASASDAAAAATLSAQIAAQHGVYTVMITQVGGFLALLAGFLYKGWTESRDRRWAKQDEVELAAVKKAELLAHQQIVIRKLDEVKTEANAAYKEANTVNLKLQTIGVKMADDKPLVSYPAK